MSRQVIALSFHRLPCRWRLNARVYRYLWGDDHCRRRPRLGSVLQLEFASRFSLEPLRLWRRLTYGHTHHTMVSVTIRSLRCRRWPSSRKARRKIALTGMSQGDESVTWGVPPGGATTRVNVTHIAQVRDSRNLAIIKQCDLRYSPI